MDMRAVLYASYLSGGKFCRRILPAPPWMISLGLNLGKDGLVSWISMIRSPIAGNVKRSRQWLWPVADEKVGWLNGGSGALIKPRCLR